MNQAVSLWQLARARMLLGGILALLLGAFATGQAHAATPPPSAVTCSGHVDRGLDVTLPDQVDYLFACSGSIKSYTVLASAPIGGFSVDAQVFQHGTETIVETDSFFCEGLIPGDGFNCTGQALVGGDVKGSFEALEPICSAVPDAPRRPKVSVVIADTNGATAGPFRLRGPEPCPGPVKPASKRHRRKHAVRSAR